MKPRSTRRRGQESGYALLLVFLVAAVIAINLYMEMPRVAFQAQRQREQMLVERGEQYKRAIGLFLRTNKNTRWPASIEELENFNNHRSLRKRYIDPMTGKDEWRLVHIANGVLTDSVLNKKKDDGQDHLKGEAIMQLAGLSGFDQNTSQSNMNAATRRRASEGGAQVGPDGQPIASGGAMPPFPGAMPALPGVTGSTGVANGLPPGFTGPTGPPSFTGVTGGAPSPFGGGGISGLLGIPTAPTGPTGASGGAGTATSSGGLLGGGSSLFGGGSAQPTAPVTNTPQGQQAVNQLINGLLTQPRPGGLNGLPSSTLAGTTPGVNGLYPPGSVPGGGGGIGTTSGGFGGGGAGGGSGSGIGSGVGSGIGSGVGAPGNGGVPPNNPIVGGGTVMGAGIAGVASKAQGDSIMVYSDQTDYGNWEFIYDPMKFAAPRNPNTGTGAGGVPASSLGSNGSRSGQSGPSGLGNMMGPPTGGSGGFPGGGPPSGSSMPMGGGNPAFGGQQAPPDFRPGKK
jgi:hypothetical protein